jgi:hypothetical protein
VPDDGRLDAALRDLGTRVAFPPTPELGPLIAARLAAPRPPRGLRWRRALLLAAALTLLAASAAAALVFGLAGLRITFTDAPPTAESQRSSLGARYGLGERMTLAEAADRSTVGVAWPLDLGEPQEVYLSAEREIVSLVYAASDDLPALAGTDVGMLMMAIDGTVDAERIEKLVHEVDATITPVSIAGAAGYWIEGRPHVLRYDAPGGEDGEIVSRLVGDVLVWESRGTLYRIESALGLEATVAIAESMATD